VRRIDVIRCREDTRPGTWNSCSRSFWFSHSGPPEAGARRCRSYDNRHAIRKAHRTASATGLQSILARARVGDGSCRLVMAGLAQTG